MLWPAVTFVGCWPKARWSATAVTLKVLDVAAVRAPSVADSVNPVPLLLTGCADTLVTLAQGLQDGLG